MKLTFGLLLHVLLSISTRTLGKSDSSLFMLMDPDAGVWAARLSPPPLSPGVHIQADPGVNSDGVIEIELDKVVSLLCRHESLGGASEELVWLRDGAAVQLKEGNKQGNSSVCVKPIHDDNGATFTCHQRQNSSISASVTLNVTCESMKTRQFREWLVSTDAVLWTSYAEKVSSVMFPSSPAAALRSSGRHSGGGSSARPGLWHLGQPAGVGCDLDSERKQRGPRRERLDADQRRLPQQAEHWEGGERQTWGHIPVFHDLFLQALLPDLHCQANRSVDRESFLLEIRFFSSSRLLPGSIPPSLSLASVDKTIKFPLMPMIAAIVIVVLTLILAVLSRWKRIMKVTYEKQTTGLVLTHHRAKALTPLFPLLQCFK